jgi:dTDP-glucose pyrophosphorylase
MKPTLVILAAGIGSRYGGLKQVEPVGPNGEVLLDYAIFDARRAGFGKIVFVISRTLEKDFKSRFDGKYRGSIAIDYVFQDMDKIPRGFTVPAERKKPWGTGHAVLVTREAVTAPFAVINADDYYGSRSFMVLGEALAAMPLDSREGSARCATAGWSPLSNGKKSSGRVMPSYIRQQTVRSCRSSAAYRCR